MISALDLAGRGQESTEVVVLTHGSVVTNIAVWLTMLSPLIGLIMALLGVSFFSQASF
jgi:hypothetical protein